MPVSVIVALFATGLAVFALGSPLGAVFLVLGAIAVSLKLGMPVTTHERDGRVRAPAQPRHER